MKSALTYLLNAARVAAWILLTGAFWFIVQKLPTHPVITDLAAVALFFVCYAIAPRISSIDRAIKRLSYRIASNS